MRTGPIAYLIPEFPGQTHIFIWREVTHLREWDVDIRIFLTRPPDSEAAGRHAFAELARKDGLPLATSAPVGPCRDRMGGVYSAARPRPGRNDVLALDKMSRRQRAATAPLIGIACVFSRQAVAQGITHVHLHSAARAAIVAMMARRLIGLRFSLTLHGTWTGGEAGWRETARRRVHDRRRRVAAGAGSRSYPGLASFQDPPGPPWGSTRARGFPEGAT